MGFKVGDIRITNGGESYVILEIISCSVKTGGVKIQFLDSGVTRITDYKSIRNNSLKSKKKAVISTGDKFNRLTVVKRVSQSGAANTKWECICDCGNTSYPTTIALTSGHTTSCGCFRDEVVREVNKTHGKTGTKEYGIWAAMKQRCYDPNKDNYHRYGARGIKVCDEWLNNFEQFYKDMGDCPEGLTIERKDCNGNYCKENCVWDSKNMQGYNTNIRINNTSGRTGVYCVKPNTWTAAIGAEDKLIHLGTFHSYDSAVKAREEAELKYYGFIKE